jgi:hypothetical protein
MRRLLPYVLAALGAVVAAPAAPARADILDRLDQPAPDAVCAKWWNGAAPKSAALRGRVVVVHLCDPSKVTTKAAAAALEKVAGWAKDEPVTIVEVVLGGTEEAAAAWAARAKGWVVGWDAEGAASAAYPGSSVPRTYLVGPDGKIAWHAHVGALTEEALAAQVARVAFYAPPKDAKKAVAAAKAASDQRFGAALAEAAKVEADRFASEADRAVVAAIRAEVPRALAFQLKLLDALEAELDWAIAWRRIDAMEEMFQGTPQAAKVAERRRALEARPSAAHERMAQQRLDPILADAAKAKTRRQLEDVIGRLQDFMLDFVHTKAEDKANEWRLLLEARLAALSK